MIFIKGQIRAVDWMIQNGDNSDIYRLAVISLISCDTYYKRNELCRHVTILYFPITISACENRFLLVLYVFAETHYAERSGVPLLYNHIVILLHKLYLPIEQIFVRIQSVSVYFTIFLWLLIKVSR